MKKLCLVIVMIFILTSFLGCAKRDPAEMPAGIEADVEEITVAICQQEVIDIEACAAFFELETGIKVNIVNYSNNVFTWDSVGMPRKYAYDAEGNTIFSRNGELVGDCGTGNYILTANTDLMAGKGADIYDVGLLDYENLGKNGLLCDMSSWVNADPNMSDEVFLHNIMKRAESEDGALYAIAPGFEFESIALNVDDWDLEVDTNPVTWQEFFEAHKDEPRQGVLYGATDQVVFMERFQDSREKFVNGNDVSLLDSPEMVKLLEQCRAWAKEGYLIDSRDPDRYARFDPQYGQFIPIGRGGSSALLGMTKSRSLEPSDDKAHQWENSLVTDQRLYGINAASQARGAAWMFIQTLLSEQMQEGVYLSNQLPVRRKQLESCMERTAAEKKSMDGDPNLDVGKEVAAVMEQFNRMDKESGGEPYDKIIRAAASQYFTGQLTAQQAAKQMADKVALYLKEAA